LRRSRTYKDYLSAQSDQALEVATHYGNLQPVSDEEEIGDEDSSDENEEYSTRLTSSPQTCKQTSRPSSAPTTPLNSVYSPSHKFILASGKKSPATGKDFDTMQRNDSVSKNLDRSRGSTAHHQDTRNIQKRPVTADGFLYCFRCCEETMFPSILELPEKLKHDGLFFCDNCVLESRHKDCDCESCSEAMTKLIWRWMLLDKHTMS